MPGTKSSRPRVRQTQTDECPRHNVRDEPALLRNSPQWRCQYVARFILDRSLLESRMLARVRSPLGTGLAARKRLKSDDILWIGMNSSKAVDVFCRVLEPLLHGFLQR